MARRASKVDANQPQLVKDLRDLGFSVRSTAGVGDDFPDLVVGAFGQNYLFEVKDPDKPPSRRELRPGQQKFFDEWRGQCHKVETLEEVLSVIGKQRRGG